MWVQMILQLKTKAISLFILSVSLGLERILVGITLTTGGKEIIPFDYRKASALYYWPIIRL